MNEFSHLLSPLNLGRTRLRNRILISAHVSGFAENNQPGKKYIEYHRQYARSGVGLQITGGTAIHKSGLLGTTSDALWNLDDSIIPGYQALSDAIHEEGGCILAQLAHSGGTVLINKPGHTSWSASEIRSQTTGNISHAMTQSEIDEVIEAYAAAAKRARQGSMDGVELLAAFGFLPQAFLSPLSNLRQDRYGGDLNNRLRFTLELITAVREALGPEPILGLRIPGDEFEPGGLELDEMKLVAKALVETGKIDYLNVIAHTNLTHTGRSRHWAPTPAPHGLFIPLAAAIREHIDIPVFGVGRVTSPTQAEKLIAEHHVDMVGMTRANICDPELTSKIILGKIEQIRPCVGANTCIANRYAGKPINCAHNAAVSQPGSKLQKAINIKKVAVVGAGPSGLEAARVAAARGHQVSVFEQSSKAGGQLKLWASTPSMRELGGIIDWRLNELERLGVVIQYGHHIDPDTSSLSGFDEIIIATGSIDYCRSLSKDQKITVVSPHQVLKGEIGNPGNAIVFNEGRGQAGLAAAEILLNSGAKVEVFTSDVAVANDLDPTNRNAWYTRLGRQGCNFTASLEVQSIEKTTVILRNVYDLRLHERTGIDLIVDWPGCRSNNDLPETDFDVTTHSIGDCVSPRTLEIAIAEAFDIGQLV